ncbi:MAG TPA: signal peptidase I, partial [Acidimicrobiales bacterium]|nr:signal peptidase I [Acidimicrobiales bacterium]
AWPTTMSEPERYANAMASDSPPAPGPTETYSSTEPPFSRDPASRDPVSSHPAPTGPEAAPGTKSGLGQQPDLVDDQVVPPGKGSRARRAMYEWGIVIVAALVAAVVIKAVAIEAFFIPSASMEPTLVPGDRVLVNRLSYDLHGVHTGDVIVFRRPPADNSTDSDLIKRVIGLPGQTIDIRNCGVFVNGKELAQPYLPKGWQNPASEYCTTTVSAPGTANLPNPFRVPAHSYFVMGDNRKDSDDSRYWGFVPGNYIVGRAFARIWPVNRIGGL